MDSPFEKTKTFAFYLEPVLNTFDKNYMHIITLECPPNYCLWKQGSNPESTAESMVHGCSRAESGIQAESTGRPRAESGIQAESAGRKKAEAGIRNPCRGQRQDGHATSHGSNAPPTNPAPLFCTRIRFFNSGEVSFSGGEDTINLSTAPK